MELQARAYEDGLDELGNPKWRFEPLPSELKQSLHQLNPTVIAKLQGDLPVIGLNTLIAWNICVNPAHGLITCLPSQPEKTDL